MPDAIVEQPQALILQTEQLSRRFGETVAVGDISFAVRRGERVGVVGADGAGKTTLLQMLAGILDPSSGDCRVFGLDTRRESKIIAARIGYMSQGFTLYDRLSVDENLAFSARIRDVPQDQYLARRNSLLQMAGLTTFTQRPAGTLSGGMRKKLSLCTNLIHEPELLILDEPGLGVDPLSRRQLWEMLDRFQQRQVTSVIATSYMDEAMRCDRVVLLREGQVLADGTPRALQEQLRGRVFSVTFSTSPEPLDDVSVKLRRLQGMRAIQRLPDRLRCVTDADDFKQLAMRELPANTVVTPAEPQLEDLFVLDSRTEVEMDCVEPPAMGNGEQASRFPVAAAKLDADKDRNGVQTQNLSIRFGEFTAVDRINLTIERGELLALLGPNGAGKTTLIRAICGLTAIAEGGAVVGGEAVSLKNRNLRRQIGYMSQKFSLYLDMTAGENLAFFANLYGLSGNTARAAVAWASAVTGLTVPLRTMVGDLSGAIRQRLALAGSILHRPAVLFLDEPTSGIDPASRYRFWEVIRVLASQGMTVAVTTHYLDEAAYCDRLALMMNGRLIAHGSRDALIESLALSPDTDMETLFLTAVARADSASLSEGEG
jgi:ABC-2 type transport system ATP-binding protein